MKLYQEIGLFLLLVIAISPLAFLLMPIIVVACIIGGLMMLISPLVKRFEAKKYH